MTSNQKTLCTRANPLGTALFYIGLICALLTVPAVNAGVLPAWGALDLGLVEGLFIGVGIIVRE